jgi:ribosomal-protein-alanine N-acetyltransferase
MMTINFTPFPVLETERLLLRRLNADDAQSIFELRSNPQTMKYVPRPLAKTIDDALAHIALIDAKINSNEGINWAISFKDSADFIGIIGHYQIHTQNFRAEVGYMLLPKFHNRGIISEALAKVVDYGFTHMGLHSIEAIIDPGNRASARVLEKNGFIREAHLRENEFYEGKFLDTVIYSLLEPQKDSFKSN